MRHRVRSVGDGRICSVRDLRIGSWSEAVVGAGAGRALSVGGCVRFPTREYSPGPLGEAGRRRDQRNRRDPRSRRASADESGDGPGFLAHGQSLSSARCDVVHAGWMGCYRLAGSQSSIRHARYNAIATPGRRTSRTVNQGNLVEPVDDRVAVDREPLCCRHEIETAFAPGDERLLERGEVILPRQQV